MKVVVLGDGLLGSEIIKQTNWEYISRKKDNFDLTDYNNIEKNDLKNIFISTPADYYFSENFTNNEIKNSIF